MSLASLIGRMIAAGMAPEDAGAIAAEIYAAGVAAASARSPGAERTRKWRHKASQRDADNGDEPASPNVTERHKTSQCDAPSLSSFREERKRESKASPIPPEWRPDETRWQAACGALGSEVVESELAKFGANARSKALTSHGWEFNWDKWIEDAKQYHRKKAPAAATVDLAAVNWRAVLERYLKFKTWPPGHGNDPDSPSCRAPRALMQELGIIAPDLRTMQ